MSFCCGGAHRIAEKKDKTTKQKVTSAKAEQSYEDKLHTLNKSKQSLTEYPPCFPQNKT